MKKYPAFLLALLTTSPALACDGLFSGLIFLSLALVAPGVGVLAGIRAAGRLRPRYRRYLSGILSILIGGSIFQYQGLHLSSHNLLIFGSLGLQAVCLSMCLALPSVPAWILKQLPLPAESCEPVTL